MSKKLHNFKISAIHCIKLASLNLFEDIYINMYTYYLHIFKI